MSDVPTPRLSADVGELSARLHALRLEDVDCDVLVVGSGYGGAVAAARLAGQLAAGTNGVAREARVWVLERGREYVPGMFPDRLNELPGHVRFSHGDGRAARGRIEGLFDVRLGGDATVLLGCGLGGGSLINAGVMVEPDPLVFSTGWPSGVSYESLRPAYERARNALQPESAPSHVAKHSVLKAIAENVGASICPAPITVSVAKTDGERSQQWAQSCTRCGDCLTGCNAGAKKSLDTTYLLQAWRRGAEFFCGTVVERLEAPVADGAPWIVRWHPTDPARRSGLGAARLRARRVVLAAGTLGSTEILLRSQASGLTLSPRLGSSFSGNGDNLVALAWHGRRRPNSVRDPDLDPADVDLTSEVGPTITGIVRTVHDGVPIVVEEFAVPGALQRLYGEVLALFGGGRPDGEADVGADASAATGPIVARASLYGLMGDDGASGRIELAASRSAANPAVEAGVCIRWGDPAKARELFAAQNRWLRSAARNDRARLVHNPIAAPFGYRLSGIGVTVHPLGGCAMGNNAGDGVVDSRGRVFREDSDVHEGLVVLDGSIVPRALGINPALTIAALAEHAVPDLARSWGFREPCSIKKRIAAPRRRIAARRDAPCGPTEVRIQERLSGFVRRGNSRWHATLDVKFDPIPDLSALLERAERQVAAVGTLQLRRAHETNDEFDPPNDEPDITMALRGDVHLLEATDPLSMLRTLRYRLTRTDDHDGSPWSVGTVVEGTKCVMKNHDPRSVWRQLSELDVRISSPVKDAGADDDVHGCLALDFDDLADREDALLSILSQSSSPDALVDLAALPLLLARLYLRWVNKSALKFDAEPDSPAADDAARAIAAALDARRCGRILGRMPTTDLLNEQGALLHHYRRPDGVAPRGHAVLLIHGLGAGGSTFTLPALAPGLAEHLLRVGRDVFVLELRTSISNEPDDPAAPRPGPWDFEEVALADIPEALSRAYSKSGDVVDVVAHCIGAAMFCTAALGDTSVRGHVGAVVLSQVGPQVRLWPLNRVRGMVASYLRQYIGIEEFDTRPEYQRVRNADGQVIWQERTDGSERLGHKLVDLALDSFPYPDDEIRAEAKATERIGGAFRTVRRRADAIFGQLMELGNVADDVLRQLEAIYGWVKVQTLAQTIHYARLGLLTNAAGRNELLLQERIQKRFNFPLMLLHGRRNRVFHWRGSLEGYGRLRRILEIPEAQVDSGDGFTHHGLGTSLQLRVLERYGHQDCLIGRDAARDVFAPIVAFLDEWHCSKADVNAEGASAKALPITCDEPDLGPVLGAVDRVNGDFRVKMQVHPKPNRARTFGLVVVPMRPDATMDETVKSALGVPFTAAAGTRHDDEGRFGAAIDAQRDQTKAMLDGATTLTLDGIALNLRVKQFRVLTLHSDLDAGEVFGSVPDPSTHEWHAPLSLRLEQSPWLLGGRELTDGAREAVHAFLDDTSATARSGETAGLRLDWSILRSAHDEEGKRQPLRFALASCQYPPGLLDRNVAESSLKRLSRRLEPGNDDDTPPQFLLALGDQIYVDATAGVFDPIVNSVPRHAIDRSYALNWRLPHRRRIGMRLPLYAMLDDHEIADNWQPGAPHVPVREVAVALQRYDAWQGSLMPERPLAVPPRLAGRHYTLCSAGARFVVLDTRTQRDRRRASPLETGVDLEQAHIVPVEVIDAALAWLAKGDDKTAKFLASPAPLFPAEQFPEDRPLLKLRSDSWSGYPASMSRILAGVIKHKLRRLVLLSGDAHVSAASRIVLDGGGPVLHSVMSSGMHAPWPFANARLEEFVLDGQFLLSHQGETFSGVVTTPLRSQRNGFAMLRLSGSDDDPHAQLEVLLDSSDGVHHCQPFDLDG